MYILYLFLELSTQQKELQWLQSAKRTHTVGGTNQKTRYCVCEWVRVHMWVCACIHLWAYGKWIIYLIHSFIFSNILSWSRLDSVRSRVYPWNTGHEQCLNCGKVLGAPQPLSKFTKQNTTKKKEISTVTWLCNYLIYFSTYFFLLLIMLDG